MLLSIAMQSKTEQYTIKQLPGLPDSLRKDSTPFRAFFQSLSPSMHEAVVTTMNNVLIWDYNTTTTSPVPTIVRLPEALKPTERLPLAAVVPTGTSNDSGLVVVCPTSGKIWYWENTDMATTYKIYSRALKVNEGLVKLMSGEIIEKMVKVEHGGYVLVLSSGRLAYLSLQDRNSRSAIEVSMLSNDSQSKGGWFGSLRATLGGGWRNTIAGVKTRVQSNRFETIALTQEGLLKVWDVEYNGSAAFKEQFDLSEDLREAFEDNGLIDKNVKAPITVIDFALSKTASPALVRQAEGVALDTIMLVAIGDQDQTNFMLVHLTIDSAQIEITRLTPIHVFKAPATVTASAFELIVPDPGHTAFIVMPNAVITVSLEKVWNNPRDELISSIFQDIVYFQFQLGADIISSAPEYHSYAAKNDTSGLLLFTKAAGAVRIAAERPSRDPKRQAISAKAKIEQQVFFGKCAEPILDFGQSGSFKFSQNDVEDAALTLSHEILTSNNNNIPDNMSSMENQLYLRSFQLRDLINFVLGKYSPISRATRWRLLWDAEKIEAAAKLWKVYEKWLSEKESDEKILFPLFVAAINEKSRGDADPAAGEVDPVRYWFTHDVDRIGKILNNVEMVILEEHKLQMGKWELLVQYIQEAQQVITALLRTAYNFREQILEAYGLQDEVVEDGVLRDGYEGLPEPWTAHKNVCSHLSGYVAQTNRLLLDLSEDSEDQNSNIDPAAVAKLRAEQWQLVFLSCLTHTERQRWLQARSDEEDRANGARLQYAFEHTIRLDQLMGLAELGRGFDAMKIAEKMHDMDGLVQLCVAEIEYLTDPDARIGLSKKEQVSNDQKKKVLYAQLEKYFSTYGEAFARAFFTAQIENGRLADLLQEDFGKQKELTKFLRARPEHWKLAWINEVTKEQDLLHAGETLLKVAREREPNIWAKTTEISIAKLALMGAEGARRRKADSRSLMNGANLEYFGKELNDRLEKERLLAEAQKTLFAHVQPQFQLGVDEVGAVTVAMETFGKHAIKDRPANVEILRQGLSQLNQQKTMSPEILIDILCLMVSVGSPDQAKGIHGQEFLWAVKVLHASGYCEGRDTSKGEILRSLIWKRLFVRDDWTKVHHTKGKRDKEVAERLRKTLLYETLKQGALERKIPR
jgi:nuclear pore complex protein Nup133